MLTNQVREYNIENSSRFELTSDQISTLNVTVIDDLELEIVGLENSSGTFLLNVYGDGNLNLNLNFLASSQWSFLYMNRSDLSLKVNEVVTIYDHATVRKTS